MNDVERVDEYTAGLEAELYRDGDRGGGGPQACQDAVEYHEGGLPDHGVTGDERPPRAAPSEHRECDGDGRREQEGPRVHGHGVRQVLFCFVNGSGRRVGLAMT